MNAPSTAPPDASDLLTPLQDLSRRVAAATAEAYPDLFRQAGDVDPAVVPSQNPAFGDFQSNAAMGLAGRLKASGQKVNPREVATRVVEHLDASDLLAEPPSIAGPGFINFRLSPAYLGRRLRAAADAARLGVPPASPARRVVVEYSSPNIAKQMHVGHIRSTILGDAVARVLEFLGHDVVRQNHVGDWGTQFGMLIARMHEAGGVREAPIGDLEAFYRQSKKRFDEDDDFKTRARETVVRLQRGDDAERNAWQRLVDATREHYLDIYRWLGVRLGETDERGESFYNDRLPSLVDELLAAGVAEPSEGAVVSFAGGFKAPLIVRKGDGGFGYGTTDLAAAEYRARSLAADRVVYFVDARQAQHFKQVFATYAAAAEKAGWPAGTRFEHASFGSVLGPDGTPLKTREGETVKLADLLAEARSRAAAVVASKNPDVSDDDKDRLARAVGIGAVKYADLSRDRTSDYVFSFDDMLRLDGNTAPYLQYAYCRIRSILDKAAGETVGPVGEPTDLHERALARQLLDFGDVVRGVAESLKPHVLCAYLYELATRFSGFYENCPVLRCEPQLRPHRLALTDLTGRTLATGLDLLGIEHPDRM